MAFITSQCADGEHQYSTRYSENILHAHENTLENILVTRIAF